MLAALLAALSTALPFAAGAVAAVVAVGLAWATSRPDRTDRVVRWLDRLHRR